MKVWLNEPLTELAFLVDLLLSHKLPKTAKDAVASRIRLLSMDTPNRSAPVEAVKATTVQSQPTPGVSISYQAPSTQRLLLAHPDLMPKGPSNIKDILDQLPVQEPKPVEVIAQNPATALALVERQKKIDAAIAGGPFGIKKRGR